MRSQSPWAVLLAGGDGSRLQSLTYKIAGDSRPKQFCTVFGDKSLLSQTRDRINTLFRRDRTLFAVTKAHEAYYREDLASADSTSLIVQPWNRGTGIAMAAATLRVLERDARAMVAFFPCDHHYADNDAFASAIRSTLALAEKHPASIILLGAEAHYPEVEYGWIEPGPMIANNPSLSRVNRFHEKPSLPVARDLLSRGCLWNTFVMVGRAATFLELFCCEIPTVASRLELALQERDLDTAYAELRAVDFSRDVLAPQADRLLVMRDTRSGWTDLGNPARVIGALERYNIEPAWLREVRVGGRMASSLY